MSARTGAIMPRLSPRDIAALEDRVRVDGPEAIHPDCRELQVIWRSGEVIVWLRNDRGLRFASGRAPRLDAAISRAQRDAISREPLEASA